MQPQPTPQTIIQTQTKFFLPEPEYFDGTRAKWEDWWRSMLLYIAGNDITNNRHFAIYVWTHNFIPADNTRDSRCAALISGLEGCTSIDLILTAVVKILLVLRLRALWKGSLIVTWILLLATAGNQTAEMIINSLSTFSVGIINHRYMIDRFPLWSCYTNDMPPSEAHILHVSQSGVAICRLTVCSLELTLTLIKLAQELRRVRVLGDTLPESIRQMRKCTPVIYVFYRDGTLFFLP
ncbi:hypothetical protein AN958_06366 [Leucoagaricus sp. SymC.cos]|nr:hypothetical protein AN958_06366 [Leucoagaricus sp. SymC.cos]